MSAKRPARILIGTASWTDPGLIAAGTFYPPGTRDAAARLRYYASQFPLVEIDASYYGIPAAYTARLWAERAPDGFVFDAKAYALFTRHPTPIASLPKDVRQALPPALASVRRVYDHDLPDELQKELWRRFAEVFRPLRDAGKLGAVLFQFPPWFAPSRESRAYLARLPELLPGYPISVELRNPRWFAGGAEGDLLALLREHGLAYVCADEPQGTTASVPPLVAVTAPLAVVRFHGRNAAAWARHGTDVRERYDYLYNDDELRGWLPGIARLAEEAAEVHLLMNNCVGDKGVRNAHDLARLLRGTPLAAAVVPPPGRYAESDAMPAQQRLL